jgi:LysM repeat protein
MNDKGTVRDIIETYRKRQKWMQTAPLILFTVVLLVVIGVGLLYNYLRDSGIPSFSPAVTDTIQPTETLMPEPISTATLSPTQAMELLFTEIPFTPDVSPTPEHNIYVVKEGETLYSISQQFNLTIQEILALNPEIDPDLITLGQQIVIPARNDQPVSETPLPEDFEGMVEYRVVSGDTLFSIAIRYNTSVEAIVQANQLTNPDDILEGDIIKIPVGDYTPEAPDPEPTDEPTPSDD